LALLGETGLRDCAAENLRQARELATRVSSIQGCALKFDAPYFNEFVVDVQRPAQEVLSGLHARGILGGVDVGRWYPEYPDCILMTATETTTPEDIDAICAALQEIIHVPTRV
ncbi:MAG: glycine dehydrogenase, partial [Candidatus Eremiobacteraeota bacterium]|nr:glycine dehydrogenase [Candidatus Eremiobacteraeota bacterium]